MEINNEFIDKVLCCDFLGNCGKVDELKVDIKYVDSEAMANEMICSEEWENIVLEERGKFTSFLSKNHRELFNKYWNQVVEEIKYLYMENIQLRIDNNWNNDRSKQSVADDVIFNIITLFMLDYYSEYYQSEFFDKMLAIYLSGHLPCGWCGDYPEGKFYIY